MVLVRRYAAGRVRSFYDATTATAVDSFTVPSDDESIVPVGSEQISGVNGVPPLNSAVEGYQEFDLDNASGNTIGTFDADVTTTTGVFGNYSETLLVTADSGTAGTAAGDLPRVGSEFDVDSFGFGYETVYSDLVSTTGANVISETLVTPMGDFAINPTMDLAANVPDGWFFVPHRARRLGFQPFLTRVRARCEVRPPNSVGNHTSFRSSNPRCFFSPVFDDATQLLQQ
jgi:hypothetical protein